MSEGSEVMFVNNETLEVMRDELRCVLNEERKNNRTLLLTKKRPAFGEVEGEQCFLCDKDVAEKARQLEKGALSQQDYILLQNSLIKDETNVNSFLQINNALDALIRDLACPNPAVQLIAASCCCNISLASSNVCNLLAKHAGPHLIAELHSLNYPLLEVCAWTIGNLSAGSKTASEILYAQGCIRAFVSLIDHCNETILPSIIYALKLCLRSAHDIITDSEVTDLSARLIRLNNFAHNEEVLWILALLSSREASHSVLISITKPVCSIVWKVLMDPDETPAVEMLTPGIRLLGNLITEPTGKAAELFLDSGNIQGIAIFFDKLLSHTRNHVKKEAFWLLGNLYTLEQPKIRAVVRENLIPLLNSLKCLLSC